MNYRGLEEYPPSHLLIASTSSAYGANSKMPYKEIDKANHQVSFYTATKKSTENMAHNYSHLFGIPTTIFRFFTVYGPWEGLTWHFQIYKSHFESRRDRCLQLW